MVNPTEFLLAMAVTNVIAAVLVPLNPLEKVIAYVVIAVLSVVVATVFGALTNSFG
ncbi:MULTISPECIES: hypothetical protein [unclassified Haloferax]|jgi:hypothetical protein|uniref:hypothetical protein n=1 Tax=unclassified Haloferax TaxID=2625095 RepID=UPI0028744E59|nr:MULTISPECIES: hypothetical protein [unclassified Haloferax]MDS0243077.1 hypothetical protein [Haloferax sp. S2CR25]MDS0446198.1 hypothetical protein [Haloferax sp. S2CR25-2]